MKITKDLIDDIFAIPRDGSNITDDDTDDTLSVSQTDNKIPFNNKTAEIADDIKKASKEKVEDKVKETIETAVRKIPEKKGYDDLFTETVTTVVTEVPKLESKKIVEPALVVLDKNVSTEIDEAHLKVEQTENEIDEKVEIVENISPPKISDTFTQSIASLEVKLNGTDRKWKLLPPSEKFQEFYEEKVDVLSNYLLRGGVIHFDKYHDELQQAHVDMQLNGYDMEAITEKMTEIMKWRDRVLYIKLHINKQLFAWRKYLDLLPGFLAQVEYERGKKEGITYRHLGDMEGYLSDIEGLNQSCEDVSSHLDAAYNSLSRQVAIAQPQKEIERSTNNVRPITPQLSRYDSLQKKNANSGSGVSTPHQKDVDKKSTEPKPSKGFWENMESGK